jgi:thiamine biosynthesis protein ThiC
MPADHLVFPGVEDVAGDVGHGEIGAGDVGHGDVGAGFTTASQVLAQQRTNLRWTDPMSGFVLRHM